MSTAPATAAAPVQAHAVGSRFAFAQFAKAALYRLQLARMTHVLNAFPDETLAEMGVARQDIPEYAATLLSHG